MKFYLAVVVVFLVSAVAATFFLASSEASGAHGRAVAHLDDVRFAGHAGTNELRGNFTDVVRKGHLATLG